MDKMSADELAAGSKMENRISVLLQIGMDYTKIKDCIKPAIKSHDFGRISQCVNTFNKNVSYICATLLQKWVYTNRKVWYNKGTERR